MNKIEIINKVLEKYPTPQIELKFSNPFELLIATILSAQAQDVRVNKVTEKLFNELKSPQDYVKLGEDKLREKIKSINFYKNKAKNIITCCKEILNKFNGKVPDKIDELVQLAGIGRKTANVIIGVAYKKPAIIVDTHVKRVSKRLGLTKSSNPEKIELELMKIVPEKYWTNFSLGLILHGRYVCKAKNPDCENCFLKNLCEKNI